MRKKDKSYYLFYKVFRWVIGQNGLGDGKVIKQGSCLTD